MKDFIKPYQRTKVQPREIAHIAKKMIEDELERLKKNERVIRKAEEHAETRITRLRLHEKIIMTNLKILYKKAGVNYG